MDSLTFPYALFTYFFFFKGSLKDRAEMLNPSIRIKNVTRKDTGKYRCEISASMEQRQDAAEVEVSLLVLGRNLNTINCK